MGFSFSGLPVARMCFRPGTAPLIRNLMTCPKILQASSYCLTVFTMPIDNILKTALTQERRLNTKCVSWFLNIVKTIKNPIFLRKKLQVYTNTFKSLQTNFIITSLVYSEEVSQLICVSINWCHYTHSIYL